MLLLCIVCAGFLRLGRVLDSLSPTSFQHGFLPLLHSSSPTDHASTDSDAVDKDCSQEIGFAGQCFVRVIWRRCQRAVGGEERHTKNITKDRMWTTNGAPIIRADNQLKCSLDVPYLPCFPETAGKARISIGLEAPLADLGSSERIAKTDSSDESRSGD